MASLMDSSGASGQANFDSVRGMLMIHVTGATASSSLTVAVGGTTVGTLTTDASGNGTLSVAESSSTITTGTTITVGDLSGTFGQPPVPASLAAPGAPRPGPAGPGSPGGAGGPTLISVAPSQLKVN